MWFLAVIPAGVYLWRRRSLSKEAASKETADTPQPEASTTTSTDKATQSPSIGGPRKETESSTDPVNEGTAQTDSPAQVTNQVSTNEDGDDWMHVEYAGELHFAQTKKSPNNEFIIAYQGRLVEGSPEPGRVFLLTDDEELEFTTAIGRRNDCVVANNGTVAVVDWHLDWGEERGGTFRVFTRAGNLVLEHKFNANLGPCAIMPDGAYAATTTYNPDCTTCLFDTQADSLLTEHENEQGNVSGLEFVDQDGSWMLRLGDPSEDSTYGIDYARVDCPTAHERTMRAGRYYAMTGFDMEAHAFGHLIGTNNVTKGYRGV